jgi:hypothetical protein
MEVSNKTTRRVRGSRMARTALLGTVAAAALTVSAVIPASASSSSASAGIARAKAVAMTAEKIPTHILQTTRLNSTPKHHKFIFIYDDIQQSQVIGNGAIAGLQAAGWQTSELEWFTANPSSLVTELRAALAQHPFAVSFAGATEAVWGSEVAAYKAAHVWLIPSVIGPQATTYPAYPIGANISSFRQGGAALGDWTIGDSHGHANVLVSDVNVYPILTTAYTGFKQAFAANCSVCKIHYLPMDLTTWATNSATTNGQIVSWLRQNPSYNYVMTTDLTFTGGLRSALNTAGLNNVKIIGAQPNPPDFSALQAGQESAFVANNNTVGGWAIADAALRLSEGMNPAQSNLGQPYQLVTRANVSIGFDLVGKPAGYISGYRHLWRLG